MLPKERLSGRKCQSCGELLSGLCARSSGVHWYASSQQHNVEKSWTHCLLLKGHLLAPKDSKIFQRFHAVPSPLGAPYSCQPSPIEIRLLGPVFPVGSNLKWSLPRDRRVSNSQGPTISRCLPELLALDSHPENLWKTWIRTSPLFCHDVCGNPHYWYYIQLFHGPMGPGHMLKSAT